MRFCWASSAGLADRGAAQKRDPSVDTSGAVKSSPGRNRTYAWAPTTWPLLIWDAECGHQSEPAISAWRASTKLSNYRASPGPSQLPSPNVTSLFDRESRHSRERASQTVALCSPALYTLVAREIATPIGNNVLASSEDN